MNTIKIEKGEAYDLAMCLGATPPSKVNSLKDLFAQDKIRAKFEEATEDLKEKQEVLRAATEDVNAKIASTDRQERASVVMELNARLKPDIDAVSDLREQEVEVELSDDQKKYLKDHFADRIALGFSRLDYAVRIATKLGIEE
jgi:hypothetical protein